MRLNQELVSDLREDELMRMLFIYLFMYKRGRFNKAVVSLYRMSRDPGLVKSLLPDVFALRKEAVSVMEEYEKATEHMDEMISP